MSIFSRVKKAKKAAEEHKKAAEVQAEEVKPPAAPYKHVPTHAALDALAATPTTWSVEETRARIAAARKRRSEMIASAPTSAPNPAYRTYPHSRANSELNLSSTHPAHRPQKDMSIDTVMQQPQQHPSKLSSRSSDATLMHDYEITHSPNAFSAPRDVPVPPRGQRSHRVRHVPSSSSSMMRQKSPLSTVLVDEVSDDELSHSSHNSSYSTTSSHTSSIESRPSPRRSVSSQSSMKLPRLPMPKFVSHKRQPPMEISSPFKSNDEYNTASSSIPTWRYEDFVNETEPPAIVASISLAHSRTHARTSSLSLSAFHNSVLAR